MTTQEISTRKSNALYEFEMVREIPDSGFNSSFCMHQNMLIRHDSDKLIIEDIQTGTRIDTVNMGMYYGISDLYANESGIILITLVYSDYAFLFNVFTKTFTKIEGHKKTINSGATFKQNSFITSSNDSTIRAWDALTGVCLSIFTIKGVDQLWSLLYDANLDKIFVGCRDGCVISLCATTGTLIESISLLPGLVYSLSYVNPSLIIATGNAGVHCAFDPFTMTRTSQNLPCDTREGTPLTPDKTKLVYVKHGDVSKIRVFDLTLGESIETATSDNDDCIENCQISPCNNYVVCHFFQKIVVFKVTPSFI